MRVFLVFLTTLITLSTALILDFSAKSFSVVSAMSLFFILVVFALNLMKFKLWGIIHARYRLSQSYPATAVFFPLIYFVAIINGDVGFEIKKILFISLIMVGVYLTSVDSASSRCSS